MSLNLVTRAVPNVNELWWIFGTGQSEWFWSRFQAGGGFYESQWLTISHKPVVVNSNVAIIDLSGNNAFVDPRDADRVTFDIDGQHVILPKNVEYFDSSLGTTTEIVWVEHFGSTTDGSLNKLYADVGNHEFNFTTAIKDSSLYLGSGWDTVNLIDHRDVPDTQYWALIRRDDNALDAYSLLTGNRVRMEGGLESRNATPGNHNYGEVEILNLADSRNGGSVTYKPGVDLPPGANNRGTFTNIDLRSDGEAHSDSFNLAYFNFIRYTSDNVWVGEATIHDGTKFSTPSDRTVTVDKYGVDALPLEGQLSVIGSSRNGTHDLIVSERPSNAADSADAGPIDGHFRLYTRSVESGLYNQFNEVFIGTELADGVVDKSYTVGADSLLPGAGSDRIYQVGTSGTDDLRGWNGTNWLPVRVIDQLVSIDYSGTTPTFARTFTNTLHDLIVQQTAPTATPAAVDQESIVMVGSTFYEWSGSSWVIVSGSNLAGKVFRSEGEYRVWDGSSLSEVLIVEPHHRVALYGFGGNDTLKGGAGRDYIFGGESVYDLVTGATGNEVWGGAGADYFGVGSLDAAGNLDGVSSVVNSHGGGFLQGYATDLIMDWTAGEDTLVVLANGVAVIGGLRDSTGLVSLNGNNIIDLRDYAAIATSDQDFDGARGGADRDLNPSDTTLSTTQNWDAEKSLAYIYDNQSIRDGNSITNEDDRTVVNDGLIVARGLAGSDTFFGSSGNDWLYGNEDSNYYDISQGGRDRIYIDQFDSGRSKHYVEGFTTSTAADAATNADLVMLNKRVIDAFPGSDPDRLVLTSDVNGDYVKSQGYDSGLNFLHDPYYNPSIAAPNSTHLSADGGAFWDGSAGGGSDQTTSYIGLGMAVAGRALLAVPFVGPIIGGALIATGTLLGGVGFYPRETKPHQNATFDGRVDAYLNVLTDVGTDANNGVMLRPSTTVGNDDTGVRFLDFFQDADAGDGYIPVVEFTAHHGEGIYGYFALHSSTETFVFLVASRDNLVENGEAILVAQVNGHLTAADFGIYDGELDIYNYGMLPDVVLRDPSITSIADSSDPANAGHDDGKIDNATNPIIIAGSVNGELPTDSFFRVYDGSTKIFDGKVPVAGQAVTYGLNTTDPALPIFTFTDSRPLGTTVRNTTNSAPSGTNVTGDDTFVLTDARVLYTVELVDGVTGIPTRVSSRDITISGGNGIIHGGDGNDTLLVTETSAYLNGLDNPSLSGIETVVLSGSADPSNNNQPIPINLNLSKQEEGFEIISGAAGDTIIGSQGADTIFGLGGADSINAGAGNDTVVYTTEFTLDGNQQPTNTPDRTAAQQLAEDVTVIGGTGFDTLRFDTDRLDDSGTIILAAPNVEIADAVFAKVIEFEALALHGTGTQTVTLAGHANTAFATGITVTTAPTATSLNFNASNVNWTRDVNVTGTNNADIIIGGSGNDTIIGGAGADMLTGGSGSDVFKYLTHGDSTYSNMDVITDMSFGVSGDKLDLSAIHGAGDVGYSTQVFSSLSDLITYAKSDLTAFTGGDDLEVFVGLVNNASNSTESGAYVLARTDDMRNWTTSDAGSTIIKLDGVSSLSGISSNNFLGIDDFYNVTNVIIGSSPNTTNLQTLSMGTLRTGASGMIYIDDQITGMTEVSQQFVSNGVSVPSYLSSYGDDIVHANQFEVYYGVYNVSTAAFTVTATRMQPSSPSNAYGTSDFKTEFGITHTLVLYDNETAISPESKYVEGFFVEGFFPETGWVLSGTGNDRILQSGTEVI